MNIYGISYIECEKKNFVGISRLDLQPSYDGKERSSPFEIHQDEQGSDIVQSSMPVQSIFASKSSLDVGRLADLEHSTHFNEENTPIDGDIMELTVSSLSSSIEKSAFNETTVAVESHQDQEEETGLSSGIENREIISITTKPTSMDESEKSMNCNVDNHIYHYHHFLSNLRRFDLY